MSGCDVKISDTPAGRKFKAAVIGYMLLEWNKESMWDMGVQRLIVVNGIYLHVEEGKMLCLLFEFSNKWWVLLRCSWGCGNSEGTGCILENKVLFSSWAFPIRAHISEAAIWKLDPSEKLDIYWRKPSIAMTLMMTYPSTTPTTRFQCNFVLYSFTEFPYWFWK